MTIPAVQRALPEVWGGVECTVNRVGDRQFDQLSRSGHDVRLGDLERFSAIGIRTLRYPLLWERLAPRTLDEIDWRWADARMTKLQELGIRPIVGLVHHGSGPFHTSLLDESFAHGLARFAGAVAERYPWVTDFTPVNEPLTTSRFSGLYGHWYPHHRSDRSFVRALVNQLKGVVLAMRAIRRVTPEARLIQTEDCGRTSGTDRVRAQVDHEEARRWLTWDLLMGRVDTAHPLYGFLAGAGMSSRDFDFFSGAECPPAIVGLNYYLTSDRFLDHRTDRYPAEVHGGNGTVRYADVEAVRSSPNGIVGHEQHLVDAWRRYGIPVAITEMHLACTRDEQMRWLAESWEGAVAAQRQGADVRAVTAWALLGSYDWNCLVTEDRGCYEPGVFDVRGAEPRPTALASFIADLTAKGIAPSHPALDDPGWWRRGSQAPERNPPRGVESADRPRILILGATGTLGRAFQRTCEERGLASILFDRHQCDVTDPHSIHQALDTVKPWAVINATGYVRVDEAERDAETCSGVNVLGPLNLARACANRGIRLVTFSSDLVFDGRGRRLYVEDDEPNPLNVYGATKAEADRLVRDITPEPLVIRSSAFFGPWDAHNFASGLLRSLRAGRRFHAADDVTVSPTYVPHLVHATLDLLIDRETGLWHLANSGEVSWYEFARMLAMHANEPLDLVVPGNTNQARPSATRPAYSALGTSRGQTMPTLEDAVVQWAREVRVHSPNEQYVSS